LFIEAPLSGAFCFSKPALYPDRLSGIARPMDAKERAPLIFSRLRAKYPKTASALNWADAWELMVATILAAQCTDVRVNMVTPELFKRWPGPKEMAQADLAELEAVIRSTGFYHNKAKNLMASGQKVITQFHGTVPKTMAELTSLPGVARKTANIVLSNAYGLNEGLAVDTHVKRLSYRLGLTDSEDPVKIEQDLMPLFPREEWGEVNHLLVNHGRETCLARKPKCQACLLADICPKRGVSQ
jgi:endonuclease-3